MEDIQVAGEYVVYALRKMSRFEGKSKARKVQIIGYSQRARGRPFAIALGQLPRTLAWLRKGAVRDTQPMAEEPTTPDLVELTRRAFEAANRRDVDAAMSFYAPDAVYESVGLGARFEGVAAILEYLGDFGRAYDEFGVEADEILELGNGVTLAVISQRGRPHGSSGEVHMRYAAVTIWVEGMIERFTTYTDIDEARAAAERLAESRE